MQMRVVADETCAPELAPKALKRIAAGEAGSIDGWYKQQLVKLACSFTIKVGCLCNMTETASYCNRVRKHVKEADNIHDSA